jgi:hypothetical protein
MFGLQSRDHKGALINRAVHLQSRARDRLCEKVGLDVE